MSADSERLIDSVVAGLGYRLWGIECTGRGAQQILRIYIDKQEGVSIEDCMRVNRQMTAMLNMRTDVLGDYRLLEVSSPGVNRRLFSPEQLNDYLGEKVKLYSNTALNGQHNFTGRLAEKTTDGIGLDMKGEIYRVPFTAIKRIHLCGNVKNK